jgi:hypothetical protein
MQVPDQDVDRITSEQLTQGGLSFQLWWLPARPAGCGVAAGAAWDAERFLKSKEHYWCPWQAVPSSLPSLSTSTQLEVGPASPITTIHKEYVVKAMSAL